MTRVRPAELPTPPSRTASETGLEVEVALKAREADPAEVMELAGVGCGQDVSQNDYFVRQNSARE